MRHRDRGFVLVYVILLICMVGLFMSVLTGGTTSMLRQTNKAQVRAIERNLQLSGLAWAARYSRKRGEGPEATGQAAANPIKTGQAVRLDAMSLSTRPARLKVVIPELLRAVRFRFRLARVVHMARKQSIRPPRMCWSNARSLLKFASK